MNIAIVARGPTRHRVIGREAEFDTIVAVNHASAMVAATWWSFGDRETYLDVKPWGHPRAYASEETLRRLSKRGVMLPDALAWESLEGPPRVNWTVFSAVAALVLAKHLGAERVTCFGVVDEFPQPGEAQRWETERRMWEQTVEWMGIEVKRE